ncbi:sensor histidine kinase [Paenibacillus xylaniclasticus]|uniref:sensor histidine kinase n=1 Tax=Paenibacillus xylaniclasticus TaxID=588083 RepID=UPI000FD6C482|nr:MULTISPECIES: HAMP domain-containing sensor histidine kinase [Paenibacillus]GFN32050.1 two-component sensor histidine kinase [Paenibacillus curdlanolyticus]
MLRTLKGIRNQWELLLGGAAAILLPLLVLAGSFIAYSNASHDRSERVALFWNQYAANYYKLHSGWYGITSQLQVAAEEYPGPEFLAVVILNADGHVVARYGSSSASYDTVRKPIVDNGSIIGYSEAIVHHGTRLPIMSWILAAAAGACGFGIWKLQRIRQEAALDEHFERLYHRMAALIPSSAVQEAGSAGDDHENYNDIDVSFISRLEHVVKQVEAHMARLETVRRSMVADFAHELRTPLAVIRSQLENTLNAGVPLPLAKAAAMHDETLHLSKLVHDLQELALAESGKLPLEKQWFSLRKLSEAVIEALQVDSEERAVMVTLQADKDIVVYADSARIRQLIVNLTGNAIRHARKQVMVDISLNAAEVVWSVTDDGYGIEEEQLPNLFERFYRGSSIPLSGDSRGLGLGLAIAKQYAEAHGGSIAVVSRWGEGTSFKVQLPVIA